MVLNEVRILQNLKHRNIIQFHNWYETKNHFWTIYEYLAGADLSQLMTQDKGLPESMSKVIIKMILDGLEYLHEQNVIFCDMKPGNLVFDEYCILKFADFTKARLINDTEALQENLAYQYLAPELLSEKAKPSIKTDIWSLGVLIYEIAAGKTPFNDKSRTELIQSIKLTEAPKIEGYSWEFNSFIKGLLQRDPQKRFDWNDICNHRWLGRGSMLSKKTLPNLPPEIEEKSASREKLSLADTGRKRRSEYTPLIDRERSSRRDMRSQEKNTKAQEYGSNLTHENNGAKSRSSLLNSNRPISQGRNASTSNQNILQLYGSNISSVMNNSNITVKTTPQMPLTAIKSGEKALTPNSIRQTSKPSTPLPLRTKQAEKDGLKSAKTKLESFKDVSNNSLFNSNMSGHQSNAEKITIKRDASPNTLRNDLLVQKKKSLSRIKNSKNNSQVHLPLSNVNANSSQIDSESKERDMFFDSIPFSKQFSNSKEMIDDRNDMPDPASVQKADRRRQIMPNADAFKLFARVYSNDWHSFNAEFLHSLQAELELQPTDQAIMPIIFNDSIELIELNDDSSERNDFLFTGNPNSVTDIQDYALKISMLLSSEYSENTKINIVYSVCRVVSIGTIANHIANSNMIELFIKLTRGAKTKQLKIAMSTLIGSLLRYATIITPNLSDFGLVSVLTEQFSDSNELVRQRAMAAYGELLFYSSTQADEVGEPSDFLWSSAKLLSKALSMTKDYTTLMYVAKTIENITAIAPKNGTRFATEEFIRHFMTILENQKVVYLKTLAINCLINILKLVPMMTKAVNSPSFVEALLKSTTGKNPDLARSALTLALTLLLWDESKIKETALAWWSKNYRKLKENLKSENVEVISKTLLFITLMSILDLSGVETTVIREDGLFEFDTIIATHSHLFKPSSDFDITNFQRAFSFASDFFASSLYFFMRIAQSLYKNFETLSIETGSYLSKANPNQKKDKSEDLKQTMDALAVSFKFFERFFSSQFIFEGTDCEKELTLFFGLCTSLSLFTEKGAEAIVNLLFAAFENLLKNELIWMKCQAFIVNIIIPKLILSFTKEKSSDSQALKFTFINDLILAISLEGNFQEIAVITEELFGFCLNNLASLNLDLSIGSMKLLKHLLEKELLDMQKIDLRALLKVLAQTTIGKNGEVSNPSCYPLLYYILLHSPYLLPEIQGLGILESTVDFLIRYKDHVNIEEIVAFLGLFFKTIHKSLKEKTLNRELALGGKSMLKVAELMVKFLECAQNRNKNDIIGILYYIVTLIANSGLNRKLRISPAIDLKILDAKGILSVKSKVLLDSAAAKKIIKIENILKGFN